MERPMMIKVNVRCSLLLLIAGLAAQQPGFAQRQFQVGVGTHIGNQPISATIAAVDALDISVREDIRWADIERTQNQLAYPSSQHNFDSLIADVLRRGKQPVIVLKGGNQFYDGGGQVTSSAGVNAYARFAKFITAHFKGQAVQFEVWNEWDHSSGAVTTQTNAGDPVAYANLLKATYPAMKAANPNVIVIGGAL